MRAKVAAAVAAMCLAIGTAPAAAGRWSFTIPGGLHIESDDGDRLRVRIDEDGRTLKVDSRGHFELNDEETDVVRLDAGGTMKIEDRKHGRTTHRLELRGQSDGSIERTYQRGDVREFDAEAKEWFAGVLALLMRNTTFDAEGHIERVLRRAGVEGALDEIEHMDGDHTQRKCYALLLEKAPDDADLGRRIAASAGSEIGSDHELSELTLQLAELEPRDEALLAACVELTRHIGSDYERRRALIAIMVQGDAGPELLVAVARSAEEIGSDHERAEVLIALADTRSFEPQVADAFFDAVAGIGSDHETKRVLVSTLARHGAKPHVAAGTARCAERIGSDHERAEVLGALVETTPPGGTLAPGFFDAVNGIGSDHEHGRVLLATLRQGSLTPDTLRDLLASTEMIGSDAKKAEVLSEVVRTQTLDDETRRAVEQVANDIGSDSQRERVLELLRERES